MSKLGKIVQNKKGFLLFKVQNQCICIFSVVTLNPDVILEKLLGRPKSDVGKLK